MKKRLPLLAAALLMAGFAGGCALTKVATVPMRVVGAVASIVPAVGNTADDADDKVADKMDEFPI